MTFKRALTIFFTVLFVASLPIIAFLLAKWAGQQVVKVIYAAILLIICYSDLTTRRIPNRVSYPAILFGLGAMIIFPGWQSGLLGGMASALLLTIPVLIYGPERAGIGDIKLALFVGLIFGLSTTLFYTLLIAFGVAAIIGLIGILLGKLHRRSLFPLGTFLALAATMALFTLA